METMLAAVRAADQDTLYSLYFPDGGRVSAAAVAGCVCRDDYLTCTECERILGVSFLAIELAARKKLRRDPPVPVACVEVEGSVAAISGMADRLQRGSRPPSDGIEGSGEATSSMADRPGQESHPPSDGMEGSDAAILSMAERLGPGSKSNGVVEGFEAGISGMAARLGLPAAVGERAKEVFTKMEDARAWPHGSGWNKFRSKCPLAYAACLSIACRNGGSALTLRELSLATADGGGAAARKEIARLITHIRRRLGVEVAGQATGTCLVSVASYVRRFSALVGLGEAESTAALEAARRLEEGVVDVRHNADSVAAGVVCMALERAGRRRTRVKDVSAATGVSCVTIYAVCGKLGAHANMLFG